MRLSRIIAPAVALLAIAGISTAGSQAAPASQGAIAPLVVLGSGTQCILGGAQGRTWVTNEAYGSEVKAGVKYRMYSLAGYL